MRSSRNVIGYLNHEASARAEAERTAVVGVGNRTVNAAVDVAALQEPNATPLVDLDDLARAFERELDDMIRGLPPASNIITNRAELDLVERALAELDRL